jgi:hypothetical protein
MLEKYQCDEVDEIAESYRSLWVYSTIASKTMTQRMVEDSSDGLKGRCAFA